MKGRRMLWLVAVIGLGLALTIAAWQWDLIPREEISTGTVELPDGTILKTRQFYRTSRKDAYKSPAPGPLEKTAAWEVQLPSGRWIDCGEVDSDCLAAYEKAMK